MCPVATPQTALVEKEAESATQTVTTAPDHLCRATVVEDDDPHNQVVDVPNNKAPAYRVRKSIVTARVKLGSTSQIFDKYEVTDDVLGTGISGAVREAVEKSTGRRYALKTLSLENITSKKAAMLHNEVGGESSRLYGSTGRYLSEVGSSKYS